jgi:hypothetical protein
MPKRTTDGTASKKRTPRSGGAEQHEKTRRSRRSQAPFAVTTDGKLLLNVDALDPLDIATLEAQGRTLFIGAELQEHEDVLARRILDNAGHDVRSRIAGELAAPGAAGRAAPYNPGAGARVGREGERAAQAVRRVRADRR